MSDAVTGADIDESVMISRGSSVLIRRIPGWQQKPIVVPNSKKTDDEKVQEIEQVLPPPPQVEEEFHDFGPDVLDCKRELQSNPPISKHDEDERIKSLVNTPSLEGYNCIGCVPAKSYSYKRMGYVPPKPVPGKSYSYKRGHGSLILEPKIPPPGYVCRRCNVPGHFIKHCPTNGDRDFDIKLKPAPAIFKPNEDAFDKEMEGISSMKHVSDLPPELFCPLCKKVMKDAVLSSKCCFNSFCDNCIREHIISKSACFCGAKDVLADYLIPNRTLREAINAMMFEKSTWSSSGNGRSSITDGASDINKSPHLPPSAAPSSTFDNHESASSSTEVSSIAKKDERKTKEKANDSLTKSLDNSYTDGIHGVVVSGEKGNRKRKKMTAPVAAGFNMCTSALNPPGMYYPFPPATYNPYWSTGMTTPLGFDGYAAYLSAGMPYVNYAPDFSNTASGGIPLQSSYGMQGYNFHANREPSSDKEIYREMRGAPAKKSKNEIKTRH